MSEVYPWQRQAWTQFEEAVQQDRLAHGIMVAAMPGLGLDWFVHCQCLHLLGLPAQSPHASEIAHPDLRWVRRQPNPTSTSNRLRDKIVIQQIRSLTEFLYQKPTSAYKVAVIEFMEECTLSAANALLKPLEEPAKGAHVILISHAPGQVPATILSRCTQLNIGPADANEASAWLTGLDERKKKWALWMTAGAPVLARELVESTVLDELIKLDGMLANMLTQRQLLWPVIEQLATQEKLLINQFLMRMLVSASRLETAEGLKTAVLLSQLPKAALISLLDDCLDNRRKITLLPTLNAQWLLADQLQVWLGALRFHLN